MTLFQILNELKQMHHGYKLTRLLQIKQLWSKRRFLEPQYYWSIVNEKIAEIEAMAWKAQF